MQIETPEKKKAQVIPFTVKTEEEKEAERYHVTFDKCSFCGEYPPKGKYIKSEQKDHHVICFDCVGKATQRLKDAGNE